MAIKFYDHRASKESHLFKAIEKEKRYEYDPTNCFRKTFFTEFLPLSIKKNNSNEKYNYFFLKFIDKRSQDREILAVFRKPSGTYREKNVSYTLYLTLLKEFFRFADFFLHATPLTM